MRRSNQANRLVIPVGWVAFRLALLSSVLLLGACNLLRRDPGDVTMEEVLRAYTQADGVWQSGDIDLLTPAVAAIGRDEVLFVHESRGNWKLKVAQVRSISDGHVIVEKPIPVHALDTGGADTIVAMKVRSPKEIVFAGSNGELAVWNPTANSVRYLSNRAANRAVYEMMFLRDGRLVVHDSNEGQHFEVWDLDAGRLITELPGAQSATLTASGNLLVARDATFEELDGRDFHVLRRYTRPEELVAELARLPDGMTLEQAYVGTLRLWRLGKTRLDVAPRPVSTIAAQGNDWNLHATYHPDGYVLTHGVEANGGPPSKCDVCLWRVLDGAPMPGISLAQTGGQKRRIIAALPLGRHRLATVEGDGTTKIWNMADGHLLRDYPGLLEDFAGH